MNLKFPIILILLILSVHLEAQVKETIDWDYEIDLLARELAEKHPDLFFRTDSASYFRAMRQVAKESPGKSVFQVAVRLQQVLAGMGDAQTQVNYHFLVEKSLIMPFECYWFEEGIYLTETAKEYEAILGKQLTAINGFPVEVVADSLATLLVVDNPSVISYHIPRMLPWFQLLEYFGFARGEELSLTVRGPGGEVVDQRIHLPVELGEMKAALPASIPLAWMDRNIFFREQYLEDEKIYYIQYNRCWSREAEEDYGSGASALFMPSFREFEKQVYPALKKEQIDKLVFDIRFNKGGIALQGSEFISKICKILRKDQGEIFVLVGRVSSGAAIDNIVDFKEMADVVLVGEETSGKPDYFGDVYSFVLPESRLIVSCSTRHFSLLGENLPSIEPDLLTPLSYKEYIQGIDPAMETVRRSSKP